MNVRKPFHITNEPILLTILDSIIAPADNLVMMEKARQSATSVLARHRAPLLVLGSQLMAAVLHALARILETRSGSQDHVHPFTVLQVRLLVTALGCTAYLGWAKTPDFPLGPPELRPLLALRAVGGLFGACGFYGK